LTGANPDTPMSTPQPTAVRARTRLPSFIVIGAARSGTTALHRFLRQHPSIFMCRNKEPNFFAFEGQALDYKGPGAEFVNNSVASLEAYRALFEDAPEGAAIGEASPLYLYSPQAASRIHARVPDARLIAILRNPVEQVYSHYLYARKEMIEPEADFIRALDAQADRRAAHWQPLFQYVDFARYNVQLRRYFQHFSRAQLKLFLYEDFAADPLGVTREIFRFIGVDDTFAPDVSERSNEGGIPRSALLQALVMRPNVASRLAGAVLPEGARRRIRDAISRANVKRDEMSVDARERLRRGLRSDILDLQELIGRDLSPWLA
jgi:hypothetical protein